MRSRRVTIAIALSVACAAAAIGCYLQASRLRSEGSWQLARGQAQAQEYAETFEGKMIDVELQTFEQRRAVLERAHTWQRLQLIAVFLSVVAAISGYVLHLIHRLNHELAERRDRPL